MMETISNEESEKLVLENQGWAESIARSVARAWNLDWRNDGLDGAAMEALLFCARRFDPSRGVPFRGYARRRIHEASTEVARKVKSWNKANAGDAASVDQEAKELSAELLSIFPELRGGELVLGDEGGDGEGEIRGALRQLIAGATILSARHESEGVSTAHPDDALDYKRLIQLMATLDTVHQEIMWKVYWEGDSMRTVAEDWGSDELNVIREHKVLLTWLSKAIATGKNIAPPRVRPGLKTIALKLKRSCPQGRFSLVAQRGSGALSMAGTE